MAERIKSHLKEQIEQFVSALTLLPPQTVSNLLKEEGNQTLRETINLAQEVAETRHDSETIQTGKNRTFSTPRPVC